LNRATLQASLGLIVFDLDRYKGSAPMGCAGDEALRAWYQAAVREMDVIGRYGGDEFVIVLPECTLDTAVIVAERYASRWKATRSGWVRMSWR
jgi:diguanylate cyclase (GGDEF)-like protein